MALFVSPPQGRDGCSAVLACNHHRRILTLVLCSCHIDGVRIVRGFAIRPTRACLLILQDADVGTFGYSVVVCRTATTSLCAASAIATTTTRTCSARGVIGCDVLGTSCGRGWLCARCRRRRLFGIRRWRARHRRRRSLQIGGAGSISCLQIEAAGIADGGALW